ncbi:hypothetical protein BDZ45DRAFT_808792 [Acephala macrosclerotiorum]|nr:hypothetical protein BDZ45DRAFT_808792 [Acephala macrosclerotiorum]
MRVAMQQLLSRKKKVVGRCQDKDSKQEPPTSGPGTFLPPLDPMGERFFAIRNKHEDEPAGHQSLPGSHGSVRSSVNSRQSLRVSPTISNPSSGDGNEHGKVSNRSQYIVSKLGPLGVLPGRGVVDKADPPTDVAKTSRSISQELFKILVLC